VVDILTMGSFMAKHFFSLCDEIWADWLGGKHPSMAEEGIAVDFNAIPEPYFWLSSGGRPLVALLTNPGQSMPHQARSRICGTTYSVPARYEPFAIALGHLYNDLEEDPEVARNRIDAMEDVRPDVKDALRILYMGYTKLKGPARSRNDKLKELSRQAGYDGVLVVECCPFHSKTFNKKRAIELYSEGLLNDYRAHLGEFLKPYATVVVAGAPSNESLSENTRAEHVWLNWLAELVGIGNDARFMSINDHAGKTTTAALAASVDGVPKVLSMMMGSNNLPTNSGLGALAKALRVA
jgi:hypothetical protein